MAIQALSSITNKGYSNISFGKRSEKPAKNHNVTSPMKAVPLAVMIAMSPLTTTNAADIMRAENNANTIELAEAPQSQGRVLIYGDSFKSANGTDVTVMALNTKGGSDSYDKIMIKAGQFEFEAKDIVDREIWLYTGNGGKEGPLRIKEVVGETEFDGEKQRFSFIDPQVVGFVEAVVAQPTNESNIKGVRKAHSNLIIATQKGDLAFVDDDYLQNTFLPAMKKNFNANSGNELVMSKFKQRGQLNELRDLAIQGEGLYGNYTIRFYDTDNNKDNFELMSVQKDGENEFLVTGFTFIDGHLHGVDDKVSLGKIYGILLQPDPLALAAEQDPLIMTDDFVFGELAEAFESPKFNLEKAGYFSANTKTVNFALGDD